MSPLEIIGAFTCIGVIVLCGFDLFRRIRGVEGRAASVGFGRKDKQ